MLTRIVTRNDIANFYQIVSELSYIIELCDKNHTEEIEIIKIKNKKIYGFWL
jgi:hypothetical protein